ncbi:hypothetical protein GUITHDRAFT_110743 [Guillardia theta CCMP2712]|uniref:Sulfotransferase domain-containing protein n=1 Tax=Guillardia theta (strain CCMP2712) TaxID=905079 RepID=L1J483_GUITC|nr:hypothetical protein GUITHDRAFT_110743 [Guillardia theta CCMP2712]EKX43328.1 hypothetical protein GUITHDRAFT_110743 [Guillardia theta CCMP2712]|eukprot:XP_005830308.1 hypothetical protein GUITHDRAFT_110743 [Guillardia theta CCMP2712]
MELYRTHIRDIICGRSTSAIPLAERSELIFLHIPKTGGETIERALDLHKNHLPAVDRAREYARPHVSFSVIRNPFDRMLSWFRFCLHGWRGQLPDPKKQCMLAHRLINAFPGKHNVSTVGRAFEAWLETTLGSPEWLHYWIFFPYAIFLGGPNLKVDFLLRFEHLSSDLLVLAAALQRNVTMLPHENSSSDWKRGMIEGMEVDQEIMTILRYHYSLIYTSTAKKLVEVWYQNDLTNFGYSF